MNNNLIPFGKYKGQPIEAIQEDKQYIDWLLAQSWFRERHQDFYTVIINNFQEASDTPQHNAMHVKFLNDDYVLSLLGKYRNDLKNYSVRSRSFESDGWDVTVDLLNYREEELTALFDELCEKERVDDDEDATRKINALNESIIHLRFFIEIKPTVSDDFPSVLRQIKRATKTPSRIRIHGNKAKEHTILLVGEYSGVGATQDEFVAFMKMENITVIFDGPAE